MHSYFAGGSSNFGEHQYSVSVNTDVVPFIVYPEDNVVL